MFKGDVLEETRIGLGMSREELAERVGCTARAVSYWETGKRVPRSEFLFALSRVTGRRVTDFISNGSEEGP